MESETKHFAQVNAQAIVFKKEQEHAVIHTPVFFMPVQNVQYKEIESL
jgi:hypothetical protein